MKIKQKITLGPVIIGLILLLSMIYSISNLSTQNTLVNDLVFDRTEKIKLANMIIDDVNSVRILIRNSLIFNNNDEIQKELGKQPAHSLRVDSVMKVLDKIIYTDAGKKVLNDLKTARSNFGVVMRKVIALIKENNKVEATNKLVNELTPLGDAYSESINNLIKATEANMRAAIKDANEEYSQTKLIMIGLLVLAIIFIIVISYLTTKSMTKPLNDAVSAANSIAKGNFVDIKYDKKDEFKNLSNAFIDMQESVKSVISDINNMSHQHDLGDIDVVIESNKYQNAYKEMTEGINKMVGGHIAVKKKAMACVKEFGEGNFDAPLEKFPGKKAFINDTIEQVRSNLKNVIAESNVLINGVAEGKMQTRANTDSAQGDFKTIIAGMNNMLDIVATPLSETFSTLSQLVEGNLSARMVKEYKGDFDVLKNNLNHTIDSLPLAEIMKVMEAMADGNLTVKMTKDYKGENLQIKEAVNGTLDSLNEILGNVKSTVDEVTRASMQVSDTSGALSQGATEQAASLEEITSSMNEIGSQTKHNAENSNIANNLANNAKDAAERGNIEMVQLTDAMNQINVSSQNISKIIKVIDEIAFQTNLLALNAAVEAARAGRHGKGFAVVAEEVRNLAARSATAAKETSEMIESSIKTVNLGSELVNKTGEALNNIKSEAVKVADIIGEITTSSNEQAQGIAQINEGLSQIDRVTQTNTASAEESASAAEELSGQASQLRELVDRFKLTGHSNSISKPSYGRSMSKGNKSLPSRHSATPMKEDDFFDLVDNHNYSSSPKRDLNPRDVIKLDEDDFDRY